MLLYPWLSECSWRAIQVVQPESISFSWFAECLGWFDRRLPAKWLLSVMKIWHLWEEHLLPSLAWQSSITLGTIISAIKSDCCALERKTSYEKEKPLCISWGNVCPLVRWWRCMGFPQAWTWYPCRMIVFHYHVSPHPPLYLGRIHPNGGPEQHFGDAWTWAWGHREEGRKNSLKMLGGVCGADGCTQNSCVFSLVHREPRWFIISCASIYYSCWRQEKGFDMYLKKLQIRKRDKRVYKSFI